MPAKTISAEQRRALLETKDRYVTDPNMSIPALGPAVAQVLGCEEGNDPIWTSMVGWIVTCGENASEGVPQPTVRNVLVDRSMCLTY